MPPKRTVIPGGIVVATTSHSLRLCAAKTPAGHTGQVFVTADKYTEAQVRPILQKLAATLDAIGNLTS